MAIDITLGALAFRYRRLDANEPWIGVDVVGADGQLRGTLKVTTDEWISLLGAMHTTDDVHKAVRNEAERIASEFRSIFERLAQTLEQIANMPGPEMHDSVLEVVAELRNLSSASEADAPLPLEIGK